MTKPTAKWYDTAEDNGNHRFPARIGDNLGGVNEMVIISKLQGWFATITPA